MSKSTVLADPVAGNLEQIAATMLKSYTPCDSCPTRATNAIFKGDTPDIVLTMCKHHARKHSISLEEQGYKIYPQNFKLHF